MVDETALARREELRRIVYGSPGGHVSDAAEELRELEARLALPPRAAGSDAGPADAGTRTAADDGPGDDGPHDGDAESEPTAPARRRRWPALLALGAAAAIVVAGSAAVLGPFRDLVDPPRGLEVFDEPPSPLPDDLFPEFDFPDEVRDSARPLGEVLGQEFWAFRGDRGEVCLLSARRQVASLATTTECVMPEEFAEHGLTIAVRRFDIDERQRSLHIREAGGAIVRWGPRDAAPVWEAASEEELATASQGEPWMNPQFRAMNEGIEVLRAAGSTADSFNGVPGPDGTTVVESGDGWFVVIDADGTIGEPERRD